VADTITKEEGQVLATRNPVPKAEREIQNLEVSAGGPPSPGTTTPDELAVLRAEIAAKEAENADLRRGNKAKDKALEDAKSRIPDVEEPAADTTDIQALIAKATARSMAEAMKTLDAKSASLRANVEELTREKSVQAAIGAVGAAAVEKYRSEAEAEMANFPGLSLAKAYRLVVPAGTPNAPATPIEGSRTPPPDQVPDKSALYHAKLGEASHMSTRGDLLRRRDTLTEAIRIQAPGIFPDRGGG